MQLVWAFILFVLPHIIGKIVSIVGLTFVTYYGINELLDNLKEQFYGYAGGLPSGAIELAQIIGVDKAVSIIFSAVSIKFVLKGLTAFSTYRASRFRA